MTRHARLCLMTLGLMGACSTEQHAYSVDGGLETPFEDAAACAREGACSCGGDASCVDETPCTTTSECPPGESCTPRGVCLPAGACSVDADCAPGTVCKDEACVPGGSCGAQRFVATPVAPNLLLVLDRSCSMRKSISGAAGAPSKWSEAVSSVDQLIERFADDVRWGLVLFPDASARSGSKEEQCTDETLPVPLSADSGPAIQTLLKNALDARDLNYPSGPCVTPIDSAVERASMEPALADDTRASHVVLVTDGRQAGCSSAGGEPGVIDTLQDLSAKGVPTFVVGFGSAAADQSSLTMFAQAGGTARPGSPAFYDASDGAALQNALQHIVGSVVGCDFALDTAPPDTDDLYVFFDKTMRMERDPTHGDGWDYDRSSSRITFYGSACRALRSGEAKSVDVVYGCPGVVIK